MKHDYTGDLVIAVEEVMKFAKASALYEMQCQINAAKALMRQQTLQADAAEMHVLTFNLAVAKTKLDLLRNQVASLPAAYQAPLSDLFGEAEQYIESLRQARNGIVKRRRS